MATMTLSFEYTPEDLSALCALHQVGTVTELHAVLSQQLRRRVAEARAAQLQQETAEIATGFRQADDVTKAEVRRLVGRGRA